MLDQIRQIIDDPNTRPEVARILEHLWVSLYCGDVAIEIEVVA